MTFKHKLSARLALMKDAVLGAVVCSALWAACSTQAGVIGPKGPDNSVTQVFVLPESVTINSGQSTQFAASGRDASGQTVPVSVGQLTGIVAPIASAWRLPIGPSNETFGRF